MRNWSWSKMTDKMPEGVVGTALIKHFDISLKTSRASALRGGLHYVAEGRYVKLVVKGETVMSDTRMEKLSCADAVDNAHGKVLVAGLGMGMILFPILEKEEVERVTVIERNRDVMGLVGPRVRSPKLAIINAVIMTWRPEKGQKFNTIYFDIWSFICVDNLPEIAILHQAFKGRLDRTDPNCWMNSWLCDYLRNSRRNEARSYF